LKEETMKRKLIATLLAAVLALGSLTACGGGGTDGGTTPGASPGAGDTMSPEASPMDGMMSPSPSP
jgi:hypothetical protein